MDKLSHRCLADHEWRLYLEVAQGLFQQWGKPWVDLFATNENVQRQYLCALEFPKRLSLRDAFRLDWNSGLLCTFPPIPLLPIVLKKIITDQAQVIMVVRDWASRVGGGHEHQSSNQAALPKGSPNATTGVDSAPEPTHFPPLFVDVEWRHLSF